MFWRGLYFFSVLLLNIGIARFFAAEKSGQIFFIVNNLALVLLVVSISLESGSTYFIASGNLDASLMGRFCLVWAVGAACLAVAGWWAVLNFTHSSYTNLPGFFASSFFFILGVLLTTYFTALFYGRKEFGLPNKILLLVNVLLIILLIPGKNHPSFRSHFLEIYFFSFFLQGLLLGIFFNRAYPVSGKGTFPSENILKKVISYSLAALTANLIYFLVNRIDYWFVEYYCTPKELGNYIQASKLAQMMLILPAILGSTLFPLFSSGEKAANSLELTAVMRVLLWLNGLISILLIGSGWFLFPVVFGDSFNLMYLLFILLIPGILSITMNYPVNAWFSAANRIDVNIKGSLLALAIICTGDLVLIPRYGILSAPMVCSAGYFCYYCYTVFMYRREHKLPWKDFLVIRKSDLRRIQMYLSNKIQDPAPEKSLVQNSTT